MDKEVLEPILEEVTIVAVDNGYADQKIAYWALSDKGEKVIQTLSYPSRAQMGAVNMSMDGKSSGVYDVDGNAWTVGANVTNPESIRGQRYAYSELNTVLVNHSLIAAGFGGKKVKLITGVPYDHYFKEDSIDDEFLERIRASLQVPITVRSGEEVSKIEKHDIYPESTAAYVDFAINNEGETVFEAEVGVAVVDVGGNTTDITYINPNNTINRQRSGSQSIGVLDVREKLGQLIREKHRIDSLRDSQLERALRTSKCQIFGNAIDVGEEIELAKRNVVSRLINYVEGVLGDGADLDKIVFVGGGAAVLNDTLSEYPHVHVPENAAFSNARGMLKYATLMSE